MSSRGWAWIRLLAGVVVLAALVLRFGAGPFADAWRVTTWPAVVAAVVLTAVATLTSAWRWRVVSRSLGLPLTAWESITAYYRSQFLNSVLPGGVVGDAHRAVRHGRASGELGTGVRATAWDRVGGQVVQVTVAVVAVVLLPSPWRSSATSLVAALALTGALGVVWVVLRRHPDRWPARDLRALLRPGVLVPLVVASVLTMAAHLAVFALALHAVGVHPSAAVFLTTALVVMVGSAIPLSVAGWGPREGVTAWAFGVVGLGAAAGLTVSVVFGVLAAVATLPGLAVLAADVLVRRRTEPVDTDEPARAHAEASHG